MEIPNFVKEKTKKWNRVLEFAANPCDAPFTIYANSARVAAGKAVVTLLSFGLGDVFRGYFRPKGLDRRNCMGRRRRRRRGVGLPEIGNEIGKRLPGSESVRSRDYSAQTKKIWLIDGIGQRVMYWFLIADVITDFAYEFVNGIYREKFCAVAALPRALNENARWRCFGGRLGFWVQDGAGARTYRHHVGDTPVNIIAPRHPQNGTLVATWMIINQTLNPLLIGVRLLGEGNKFMDQGYAFTMPYEPQIIALSYTGRIVIALTDPIPNPNAAASLAFLQAFTFIPAKPAAA